jgi:hypothetical protein
MIQYAIQAYRNGEQKSIRATAKAYNISKATLCQRLVGGITRQQLHTNQQVLSSAQEKLLCQWIHNLDMQGNAPSHDQVREMALQILWFSGGLNHLGV